MMLGDIARFRDITKKSVTDPPPWSDVRDPEHNIKPPWVPRKIPPARQEKGPEAAQEPDDDGQPDLRRLPAQRKVREFPQEDLVQQQQQQSREEKAEGSWWCAKLRRWLCSRRRRERQAAEATGLSLLERDADERDEERRVRRITPSCYSAMEIHGFFGLVDDGPCSSGRMLIVHQPSWVRGAFLDMRDGDDIHVWHVAGTAGGVLRVLSTGRHRYYSPGQKVTTCTVCVPEEQWERLMQ